MIQVIEGPYGWTVDRQCDATMCERVNSRTVTSVKLYQQLGL